MSNLMSPSPMRKPHYFFSSENRINIITYFLKTLKNIIPKNNKIYVLQWPLHDSSLIELNIIAALQEMELRASFSIFEQALLLNQDGRSLMLDCIYGKGNNDRYTWQFLQLTYFRCKKLTLR